MSDRYILNKLAQAVMLVPYIRKVHGSNLGQETDDPD
jgi:hypothetical protein